MTLVNFLQPEKVRFVTITGKRDIHNPSSVLNNTLPMLSLCCGETALKLNNSDKFIYEMLGFLSGKKFAFLKIPDAACKSSKTSDKQPFEFCTKAELIMR